jgi:ligand-binding SRPBCC domain-containing protein
LFEIMPRTRVLTFRSTLGRPPGEVWAAVSTMEGINFEFAPLMKMTYPPQAGPMSLELAPLNRPLFSSWVLLLFVPIDLHTVTLERVTPGVGFRERSSSLTERVWVHERTLSPAGEHGCELVDRLELTPRLSSLTPLLAWVVSMVFRHRHRRLRRRFGA